MEDPRKQNSFCPKNYAGEHARHSTVELQIVCYTLGRIKDTKQ